MLKNETATPVSSHGRAPADHTQAAAGATSGQLRLAVLLLGLAVMAAAQTYLNARRLPFDQSKMLFLAGLLLAGAALVLPRVARGAPETPNAAAASTTPSGRRLVAPLYALSGALSAVAAAYGSAHRPHSDILAVWVASLLFLGAGLLLFYRPWQTVRPPRWPDAADRRKRICELAVLAAIMCLALSLRVYRLTTIPTYINTDEASHGLEARLLLEGRAPTLFENSFADLPRMTWAPVAAFLVLPGDQLASLRLSSVITSIITLPLLYLSARLLVGRAAALLAVFLLSVAVVDINYARQGIDSIQNAPLTVGAIYFLMRTVRDRRSSDAVICGLIGGLSLYSYFPSRAIPLTIALVLLSMMLLDRRRWRVYVRLGLAILLAAFVVLAPQLGYYVSHPQALIGHTAWHMWWAASNNDTTMWQRFKDQLDRTIWSLNYHFDSSFHYGQDTRVLDAVTAILFFVGLVVSLARWRRPAFLTLNAWFLCMTLFVSFLAGGTPSTPRLLGLIPAICLMAATGAERIWETVRCNGRAVRLAGAASLALLVPALVFAGNYDMYFQRVAQSYVNDSGTRVARYLQQNSGQVTAFMAGADIAPDWPPLHFLAPDVPSYALLTWDDFLPVRQPVRGDAVFIAGDAHAPGLSYAREYYPQGTAAEERGTNGRIVMSTYRVSGSDITALQGLPGAYRGIESGATADRKDAKIDFNWDQDRPAGITGAFTVAWDGSLYAPDSGSYHLRLEGNGAAALSLDGKTVTGDGALGLPADAQRDLARGWHTLHLDYKADGGQLKLLWAHGGQPLKVIGPEFFGVGLVVPGLSAAYYAGTDTSGAPAMRVIEPALFNRSNAFVQKNGWKPYVATWKGALSAETAGEYKFAARAVDGDLELRLDGRPVLTIPAGTQQRKEATVQLAAGQHPIDMIWRNPTGRTEELQVWWAPPGSSALSPLPARVLSTAP